MAAVTRISGIFSVILAVVLPLAGIIVVQAMPAMAPWHQWCVSVLALVGAVYALVKAGAESRAPFFVAYLAVAFYSILWWYIARRGGLTQTGIAYAGSVALVIGGILFAWDRLRIRYGNLALDSIGGLAQPMPKFALTLALVVMAGIGLPPFGTALIFVDLFVDSGEVNVGTPVVLLIWFGLSWYMFTLMQRLLFGPQRTDLRYQDLKPAEVAAFAGLLLVLIAFIVAPDAVFAKTADIGIHSIMELK
jgi:NADH:ubiquinone oxidoreductase subunit 4 (subunit M)